VGREGGNGRDMKSDLVDIAGYKRAETGKAILFTDTGDEEDAVWLPKSQIEMDDNKDGTVTVTLPEWLAKDKGLI
jgi:hypothetical protein